jgi:hypothetical protein
VANDASHVLYYEYRLLDASGIGTLEATTSFSDNQGARRAQRSWGDLAAYSHRSWQLYGSGDSWGPTLVKTARGAGSACYGVRGQNVWYSVTSNGSPITLTGVSGGDPDLWVTQNVGGQPGATVGIPGINGGTSNESVSVPAGNYFVLVHIWASFNGGCTNYTINW